VINIKCNICGRPIVESANPEKGIIQCSDCYWTIASSNSKSYAEELSKKEKVINLSNKEQFKEQIIAWLDKNVIDSEDGIDDIDITINKHNNETITKNFR